LVKCPRRELTHLWGAKLFLITVVIGNETDGISKEVLKMADEIVEIPMFGVNKSLNVMVSCGIVLFEMMKKFK